jgi:hypothetical protein
VCEVNPTRGRKELRMKEGSTLEEDYEFGELHRGRRYKRKNNGYMREDSHREKEVWEPFTQVRIVEIPYIRA